MLNHRSETSLFITIDHSVKLPNVLHLVDDCNYEGVDAVTQSLAVGRHPRPLVDWV